MKKHWLPWILILLLLPGNIFLAVYYIRTQRLARAKFPPGSNPEWRYQSLNPEFIVMGSNHAPENDFWCLSRQNAVQMKVRNKRIVNLTGCTSENHFNWTVWECGHMLSFDRITLLDFNEDQMFDYRSDTEKNRWISYLGQWLPVKTFNLNQRTAEANDGRRFQWKNGGWLPVP